MSHHHGPTADVSVRPGIADDARAIAAIQIAAWRADAVGRWPQRALDELDVDAISAQWSAALTDAPSRKHHMLTACAGPIVVGFAALAPVDERTGEIVALDVSPARRREGHGSRLLAACVDLLGVAGASAVTTWISDGDSAREQFFSSAGLAPTGVRRTVDVLGTEIVEQQWGASL